MNYTFLQWSDSDVGRMTSAEFAEWWPKVGRVFRQIAVAKKRDLLSARLVQYCEHLPDLEVTP